MSMPPAVPISVPRNRFVHALFYDAPVVVWLLVSLLLATSLGSYNASVSILYAGFAFFAPDAPPPNISGMYALVHLFRRGAYFFVYGGFVILLIRAFQRGAACLRRRTIWAVVCVGIVFAVLDNAVRNASPERHGGVDDLLVSLAVVVVMTGIVFLFFAVKYWERTTLAPLPPSANVSDVSAVE